MLPEDIDSNVSLPIGKVGNNFRLKIVISIIAGLIIIGGLYLYFRKPAGVCNDCGGKWFPPSSFSTTSTSSTNTFSSSTSSGLPNVPYSFLTMHVEDFNLYDLYADDTIALANKYHTLLTWVIHPQLVRHILEDPAKVQKIHAWQAQGHEFGIHSQGCVGEGGGCAENPGQCLGPNDAKDFEALLGKGNVKTVVGGGSPNPDNECIMGDYVSSECTQFLPASVKYFGRGRWDGRNAFAVVVKDAAGKEFYGLGVKSGYSELAIQEHINQYNTLYPEEIYDFNMHTEWDNLGLLETWLKFLSEKDPEGLKRKTQSQIMEEVIIPSNRFVDINKIIHPENYTGLSDQFKKCTALVGDKITSDGYWYSMTELFNFGRCLNTGTFCLIDETCSMNDGWGGNFYIPTKCSIGNMNNIANYKPISETCKVVCGDNRCDRGEDVYTNCPVGCPADCGGNRGTGNTAADRCKDLLGTICRRNQTCSGKVKSASDTESCCVGRCIDVNY